MKVEGSVALVTGANRGLGKAYVEALRAAGAAKSYAGARQPPDVIDSRVIPIRLDVTSQADVESAAQRCQDVNILINNAGVMLKSPMLAEGSDVYPQHQCVSKLLHCIIKTEERCHLVRRLREFISSLSRFSFLTKMWNPGRIGWGMLG